MFFNNATWERVGHRPFSRRTQPISNEIKVPFFKVTVTFFKAGIASGSERRESGERRETLYTEAKIAADINRYELPRAFCGAPSQRTHCIYRLRCTKCY